MRSKITLGVLGTLALSLALTAVPARAQCPAPEEIGAAIAAKCPCSGQKNHGQYVSCVVRFRNDLRKQKCLTAETQRLIARCAARSTCGKPTAVLCCKVTGTGTCNGDTMPGDTIKTGTCSNSSIDAPVACDTDADCTLLSGPKIRHDAASCTEHGGFSSGTGSVCSGCATPVACCSATGTCQVLSTADCSAQGGTANPVPSCDPNPCAVPTP